MIADPSRVLERLRQVGLPGDHPFAIASMMLKRFKWDWQEADAECRRSASRLYGAGKDDEAEVMRLAARICEFWGEGR